MIAAHHRQQAGRPRGWAGFIVPVVLASLLASLLATAAVAQETFLGVPVTPEEGIYKVIDNVNIRTKPTTASRRTGVLRKGERVESVGRPKDPKWLAVRRKGEDLGFVYAPMLELLFEKKIKPDFQIPMTPASGAFMAFKEVNVRAKPKKTSRRIGRLGKGERVEAVGQPEDDKWLAVSQDGEDLGFVYTPMLLPLIDGSLDGDVTGRVSVTGGATCGYAIRYEGRGVIEGEPFDTFDYDLTLRCIHRGTLYEFLAPMFITEFPYDLSRKPVYQISIDVLEVGDRYDVTFSTVSIYHREDRRVVFDGVSFKNFKATPPATEIPVADIAGALAAAVEIAIGAWNNTFWKALADSSR